MRSIRFDGTFDGYLLKRTEHLVQQIERSSLSVAQIHSHLNHSEAVQLLSDLMELPDGDFTTREM